MRTHRILPSSLCWHAVSHRVTYDTNCIAAHRSAVGHKNSVVVAESLQRRLCGRLPSPSKLPQHVWRGGHATLRARSAAMTWVQWLQNIVNLMTLVQLGAFVVSAY